jgi:hypothetical protein
MENENKSFGGFSAGRKARATQRLLAEFLTSVGRLPYLPRLEPFGILYLARFAGEKCRGHLTLIMLYDDPLPRYGTG